MAIEDFSTYTEQDPTSQMTITSSKVSVSGIETISTNHAWCYKDKGAAHFNGNFEHLITTLVSLYVDSTTYYAFWFLSNLIDAIYDQTDYICFEWLRTPTKYYALVESVGGSGYGDVTADGLFYQSIAYCTIKRDESIGTYGTLYCYMYSDAARTTLVDTLSQALHSKADFQYIFAGLTAAGGAGSAHITGYTENLDLQEKRRPKTSPLNILIESL